MVGGDIRGSPVGIVKVYLALGRDGKWVVVEMLNEPIWCRSAEGEGVDAGARIEESDLKGAIVNRAALTDQLVQPRCGDCTVATVVDVVTVVRRREMSVDGDPEPHTFTRHCRTHHQVQIPGVEPVGDKSARLVQDRRVGPNRPVSRQRPMIEPQMSR